MKKYLTFFLLAFVIPRAYAAILVSSVAGHTVAQVCNYDNINFDEIRNTNADKYVISNSSVVIDNFADWQNWVADVEFGTGVSLNIKNLNDSNNGEKLNLVTSTDVVEIVQKDTYNLYKITLVSRGSDVFLDLVRETDYEKVFDGAGARGSFVENIRLNNPNDKMVSALDRAGSNAEVNSIMNASYHFNPMVLMNPVKTINRATLLGFFTDESDFATGADVDFVVSNKINNYGGHAFIADKYKNLYFKIRFNLNSFSYSDDFNDFSGFSYGADVRAKYYMNKTWFDGLLGINQTSFKAENIYDNGAISNNPKGLSEYARFSIGYDTNISDFVLSPFIGMMFQKDDIMGLSNSQTNLHTGLMGKYSFITDGIKYVYGGNLATDEKTNINLGASIGFVSVVDDAGAGLHIDMFQDDFATNYKFSIRAKVKF